MAHTWRETVSGLYSLQLCLQCQCCTHHCQDLMYRYHVCCFPSLRLWVQETPIRAWRWNEAGSPPTSFSTVWGWLGSASWLRTDCSWTLGDSDEDRGPCTIWRVKRRSNAKYMTNSDLVLSVPSGLLSEII